MVSFWESYMHKLTSLEILKATPEYLKKLAFECEYVKYDW